MTDPNKIRMWQSQDDQGTLQVNVLTALQNRPVSGAKVTISYTGVPDTPLEELTTDQNGNTPDLKLATPPLELSLHPTEEQPYSEYTIRVEAPGYEPTEVSGS